MAGTQRYMSLSTCEGACCSEPPRPFAPDFHTSSVVGALNLSVFGLRWVLGYEVHFLREFMPQLLAGELGHKALENA